MKYFLSLICVAILNVGALTSCGIDNTTQNDSLTVDPVSFRVYSDGGTYCAKLKTDTDYTVKVEEGATSWLSVSSDDTNKESGVTLSIVVTPLEDVHGREGRILITAGSQSAQIAVSQSGQIPILTIDTGDRMSPAEGETFSVSVTTNMDEVEVSAPSWITATKTNAGFDFTISANTTDEHRSSEVLIVNSEFGREATFNVSQKSTKSMYILAFGNSFSWDAMEYLYQILQEMGYKDIFLGNLYIGGATLQIHANNIASSAKAYQYRTNSNGNWASVDKYTSIDAMKERYWDYVSMQQNSCYYGAPDSFEPYISNIVAAVKQHCPGAKCIWHMTWAYQSDCTNGDFVKYFGKNQTLMFETILDVTKTQILPREDFQFVIPCGTAVQNLRTSYMGDNITRDGYHMTYDNGRLLTGLMWARQIVGKSISNINYKPSAYTYTDDQITVIKEAVENAFNKPYEITESSIPTLKP